MCLLSDNYQYLNTVALRIAKDKTEAKDLICETYLQMHEKGKIPEGEAFIKIFCSWMKNCHRPNGHFNKQKFKEVLTECTEFAESIEQSDDEKYKEIELFKKSLPLIEEVLFDLHYEKGKSCREIATMLEGLTGYKTSHTSINSLIKPIRIKLKQHIWKQ